MVTLPLPAALPTLQEMPYELLLLSRVVRPLAVSVQPVAVRLPSRISMPNVGLLPVLLPMAVMSA